MLEGSGLGRMERRGGPNDGGGIDLLVRDGRRTAVVEYKHRPSTPVGRPAVQKLR